MEESRRHSLKKLKLFSNVQSSKCAPKKQKTKHSILFRRKQIIALLAGRSCTGHSSTCMELWSGPNSQRHRAKWRHHPPSKSGRRPTIPALFKMRDNSSVSMESYFYYMVPWYYGLWRSRGAIGGPRGVPGGSWVARARSDGRFPNFPIPRHG